MYLFYNLPNFGVAYYFMGWWIYEPIVLIYSNRVRHFCLGSRNNGYPRNDFWESMDVESGGMYVLAHPWNCIVYV